jgi:hypothetical protein
MDAFDLFATFLASGFTLEEEEVAVAEAEAGAAGLGDRIRLIGCVSLVRPILTCYDINALFVLNCDCCYDIVVCCLVLAPR